MNKTKEKVKEWRRKRKGERNKKRKKSWKEDKEIERKEKKYLLREKELEREKGGQIKYEINKKAQEKAKIKATWDLSEICDPSGDTLEEKKKKKIKILTNINRKSCETESNRQTKR